MAKICPVCGEKVGGFAGKAEPFQRLLEEGQALGVYKDGICLYCLKSLVEELTSSPDFRRGRMSRLHQCRQLC